MPSNNTGREKTIASNDRRALIPLPLPIAADPFSLVQPELSLARPSSKLCPRAFLSAKLRPDRVIHYGRGGRGGKKRSVQQIRQHFINTNSIIHGM